MENFNHPKKQTSVFYRIAILLACLIAPSTFAQTGEPKAFVYTELQLSAPFESIPWQNFNTSIKQQPGFINKTWLSGISNNSVGGFYSFDSIENAQKFVTDYFPNEANGLGVAQTTHVFNATAGADADAGSRLNLRNINGSIDPEIVPHMTTPMIEAATV